MSKGEQAHFDKWVEKEDHSESALYVLYNDDKSEEAQLPHRFKTALWSADLLALEKLISLGINVNSNKIWDSLLEVVASQNIEIVKLLLRANINAERNDPETSNHTPLTMAVYKRNLDIVKLLLDYGCDTERPGYVEDRTPIILATELAWLEGVQILLQYGAKAIPSGVKVKYLPLVLLGMRASASDIWALDLLYDATMAECSDDQLKQKILDRGVARAVHYKSHIGVEFFLSKGGLANQILRSKKDYFNRHPYFEFSDSVALLRVCLLQGNPKCFGLLLKYGANPTSFATSEKCLWSSVIRNVSRGTGHEYTRLLLEAGLPCDGPVFEGEMTNLLYYSLLNYRIPMLILLLKENAEASLKRWSNNVMATEFVQQLCRNLEGYGPDFVKALMANGLKSYEIMTMLDHFYTIHEEAFSFANSQLQYKQTRRERYEVMLVCPMRIELTKAAKSPMRLTEICRAEIRQRFRENKRERITESVSKLPLPLPLKNYLLLEDLMFEPIDHNEVIDYDDEFDENFSQDWI